MSDALSANPGPLLPASTVQQSEGRQTRFDWHDVERIVKWGAVSYALGFLTVMMHTYRLGIPVLQFMEPLNIWIGAPLTVVLFFLDKIVAKGRKIANDFLQGVREAMETRKQLSETGRGDLQSLQNRIKELSIDAWSLLFLPFGQAGGYMSRLTRPIIESYVAHMSRSWPRSKETQVDNDATDPKSDTTRIRILAVFGNALTWIRLCGLAYFALNSLIALCFIPFACWQYMYTVYPMIPQKLGGGSPISVKLILAQEAIPTTKEFADWNSSREEPWRVGVFSEPDNKPSILVPVTLYFRTDHELYVQKGSGPIVALADHQVEGIVFDGK